ncbi:UxaA family hydrolase [Neomoorella thermoacetica]|uniref:UxaA family hydrolase n=1 Tax=Neomoorella thermoacetica TaxID=1525 RepID=UPI00090849CA|nr:UxaA family hydrolase [Moorella thermoacetica]APC09145.1 (2R)-sulfolactate sulfo-lyase subunit beta [Moorella thermoacetica]
MGTSRFRISQYVNLRGSQPTEGNIGDGSVLHFFTPGQGNIVGNPVIPVIKICANPVNVATMSEDIDVDAEALSHKEFILTNRSAS